MFKSSFSTRYTQLVKNLPLTQFRKDIILNRYVRVVEHAEADFRRTRLIFIILTNTITISGVMITAILSLEKIDSIDQTIKKSLFWLIWTLSILLTLANKWLYSYNIDKCYIMNTLVTEKLYSEGWEYISGIGKYKNLDHDERFVIFTERVEQIKMKSIENMNELNTGGMDGKDLLAGAYDIDETSGTELTRSRKSKKNLPAKYSFEDMNIEEAKNAKTHTEF